jgi:hypothetical protein
MDKIEVQKMFEICFINLFQKKKLEICIVLANFQKDNKLN